MKKILSFWKSKTLMFGYALTAAGVLYENFEMVRALIPPGYQGVTYSVLGLSVIALRAATSKPLEK
jgi:hypothetical protein